MFWTAFWLLGKDLVIIDLRINPDFSGPLYPFELLR